MAEVAVNLPFDANEVKDIACQEFRKRLDGLSPLMGAKEYSKFELDFEVKIKLSRLGAATAPTDTLAWGHAEKVLPGPIEVSGDDAVTVEETAEITGYTFETKDPNDERLERDMPLTIETPGGKGGVTRRKARIKA
jgi:hypothetical protein